MLPQTHWFLDVLQTFQSGGFMMWPLLFLSITALAIIVERIYSLRTSHITPIMPITQALNKLRNQSFHESEHRMLLKNGATGQLLHALLRSSFTHETAERQALIEGQNLELRLTRFTHLLGTIAMISPLIGLLGTVLGMISVFQALVQSGENQSIADGLSVALITTAFGLIVAIPSTFSHRHFTHKTRRIMTEYYAISQLIIDSLFPSHEGDTAQRAIA